MRGNKIIIIIVVSAVMAAIGFWRYAGGFLDGSRQKPEFQPPPKTESVKGGNKNSDSIDLVRPPFLDEQ